MIDSNRVTEIFFNCLFKNEEIIDCVPVKTPVIVHGIETNVGFHPNRLESHKTEVKEILAELPIKFQPTSKGGGGGWSFLNTCMTKDINEWTDDHRIMEQLCLLSIGLKLAVFSPQKEWKTLPENMPYFQVLDNE